MPMTVTETSAIWKQEPKAQYCSPLPAKYDGNGNRTAKSGTQGLAAGSSALDISYRYDVRGQLLEEQRNGAAVSYTYDAAGNRISRTETGKETRYHYNAKNQLLREENENGIKSFTYDRQGGIMEEGPAGIRRFMYNSRHQQTRVKTEAGNVQENRYDAHHGADYVNSYDHAAYTSYVASRMDALNEKYNIKVGTGFKGSYSVSVMSINLRGISSQLGLSSAVY